ncbi:DUF4391 domain-containing protein [Halopseudomonas yangmingensis]|uniref:Methyl-accepting chemotaxis protein n=1 Tax=Halopseudomonas yangmingensis TaxID=1720063 RepID=A0A1I4UPF9_9GAMM|nr:DUF4391 domain-containing protein [Halopseudomonas yangmingensis]SFM90887.1 protein of unknown function [Halopseudomonas yangmingensis]
MTASPASTLSAQTLIQALHLPEGCRVDQRVPKKLLLENGAPTVADKRLITEAIEEIQWVAALKPNTIGVPDYRDELREYLEIAVLAVTVRGVVKPASQSRLAELVHRAVPYPVLLLMMEGQSLTLSLAHKRWAQNEADKVVLDGSPQSLTIPGLPPEIGAPNAAEAATAAESAFVQSLSIMRQPQVTLYALYQGWVDCLQALLAARLTGSYQASTTPEQAAKRRQALADCERLEAEISRLRAQAAKEKQLARQVELNLMLKRVQAELAAVRGAL